MTKATEGASRIKIAVQKSGRLTEHTMELLVRCGLVYSRGKDQLICYGENMPIDILLYERDSLKLHREKRIYQDDEYFKKLSASWSEALRAAFTKIEEFNV